MTVPDETSRTSSPASSMDGDAFNSADAKIHFGPVTSPEKRIAAALERERNLLFPPARASPLRRSPRLSIPIPESPSSSQTKDPNGRPDGNAERQDLQAYSRAVTPENEGVAQDEPSSVLASRIMRAQDNPSPPPQFSETSSSLSKLLDIPVSNFTTSPSSDLPFICANYEESSTPDFIYHAMPNAPYSISTSPPQHADLAPDSVTEGVSEPPQPPLISLDSFTTPTTTPALFSSPGRSPSNPLLALDQTLNVPTLSPIPVPADSVHNIPAPCFTKGLVLGENESSDMTELPKTPDAVEEQIVADALIVDPEAGQNSAITPAVPGASEEKKDAQAEAQQTPLRRSTRPRRSTAAYGLPLRDGGQESALVLSGSPEQGKTSEQTHQAKESARQGSSSPRRIISPLRPNTEAPLVTPSRERSSRKTSSESRRELGSLSPSSVTILGSLLPAPSSPPRETQDIEPAAVPKTPVQSFVPGSSKSVLLPDPRPTPPIRFPSPKKPNPFNKIRLQPADPDDPNRTPARRIPIRDAVASGQLSPQKGAQILFGNRPITGGSKPPVLRIPSTDSPARRVMISNNSGSSPSKRFASPVRSRSVEPQPAEPLHLKQRGSSVEPIGLKGKGPIRPTLFSRSGAADRLPYPIVANVNIRAPIPEENEPTDQETRVQPHAPPSSSQPTKSRLKQPTSKIPRIGTKPYAKPTTARQVQETSAIQGKTVAKMRRVDWSKPSESGSTSKTKLPSGLAQVGKLKHTTLSSPVKPATASSSTLSKRKRSHETVSPTKLTPIVLLPSPRNQPVSPGGSHARKPGLVKLRAVVDKEKGGTQPAPVSQPVQEASRQDNDSATALPASDPVPSSPPSPNKQTSSVLSDVPLPNSSTQSEQPILDPPSSPPSHEPTDRRSTRSSRNAQFTMKVEPPRRRKNVTTFQDSGPFSNMSVVALRALTNSNTTKNQKYLAATLETEVIRKEGPRPESPVMKVKTITQKEKEEKVKDRNARAERRAMRQTESSNEFADNDADLQSTDTDDDGWDELDSSPSSRKHARGPGDDEDYESPPYPVKRLRLDDEIVEEEVEIPGKKRVKWDRGLRREIYLDDVHPRRNHSRTTEENVKKGCLAPTAKALILDNLGNLPNAESPLKDIVRENIVVKKFVYDNDLEPVVSTPTVVVKNTRSKSKKSKS